MSALCEKRVKAIMTVYCAVNSVEMGEVPIGEVAKACKENLYEFKECITCLYEAFSDTTADEMAKVALNTWYGTVSPALLTDALKGCLKPDGQRAYTDAQISSAVSADINLTVESFYAADDKMNKVISLCKGDLTALKKTEHTDFLVISALPNDYSTTSGSMINALSKKGISIQEESKKKAADYRSDLDCWVSSQISSSGTGLEYDRIIVFEPASPGTAAADKVSNIFTAVRRFMPQPANPITINSSLICTNSGGANDTAILTALFEKSKAALNNADYPVDMVRISLYNVDYSKLIGVFNGLKNK